LTALAKFESPFTFPVIVILSMESVNDTKGVNMIFLKTRSNENQEVSIDPDIDSTVTSYLIVAVHPRFGVSKKSCQLIKNSACALSGITV
jgi:hypothetical protein